jgi:hypothetical protein
VDLFEAALESLNKYTYITGDSSSMETFKPKAYNSMNAEGSNYGKNVNSSQPLASGASESSDVAY